MTFRSIYRVYSLELMNSKKEFREYKILIDRISLEFKTHFIREMEENDIIPTYEKVEETSPSPATESRDHSRRNEKSKKEISEHVKSLFKKIAAKIHPDKLQKLDPEDEKRVQGEKLFQEARDSLDDDDFSSLLKMAEKLDIEPPDFVPTMEDIQEISKKLDKVREETGKIKKSLAWQYYLSGDKRAWMKEYAAKVRAQHWD